MPQRPPPAPWLCPHRRIGRDETPASLEVHAFKIGNCTVVPMRRFVLVAPLAFRQGERIAFVARAPRGRSSPTNHRGPCRSGVRHAVRPTVRGGTDADRRFLHRRRVTDSRAIEPQARPRSAIGVETGEVRLRAALCSTSVCCEAEAAAVKLSPMAVPNALPNASAATSAQFRLAAVYKLPLLPARQAAGEVARQRIAEVVLGNVPGSTSPCRTAPDQ